MRERPGLVWAWNRVRFAVGDIEGAWSWDRVGVRGRGISVSSIEESSGTLRGLSVQPAARQARFRAGFVILRIACFSAFDWGFLAGRSRQDGSSAGYGPPQWRQRAGHWCGVGVPQ